MTENFQLPAEWEPHQATWLAWPYDEITFPGRVAKVEKVFSNLIRALCESEALELLVRDLPTRDRVSDFLASQGIELGRVNFHLADYADVWTRDYTPSFTVDNQNGQTRGIKWIYNAYGNKLPELWKDNEVFKKLDLNLELVEPKIVMEGGAIEVNGQGTLLTTELCLLNPNRNPMLTRQQIEKNLAAHLGVSNIIWLKEGIVNDHTDGHIDDVARFVAPNKIVCAFEDDERDENYDILNEAFAILERARDQNGNPFELVKLPMPHLNYEDGAKAPASYTNFYIGNTVVLVPTFNDANDIKALEILQSLFPARKVIGIDSTDLIYGGGSVHCVTHEQPRQG